MQFGPREKSAGLKLLRVQNGNACVAEMNQGHGIRIHVLCIYRLFPT